MRISAPIIVALRYLFPQQFFVDFRMGQMPQIARRPSHGFLTFRLGFDAFDPVNKECLNVPCVAKSTISENHPVTAAFLATIVLDLCGQLDTKKQ